MCQLEAVRSGIPVFDTPTRSLALLPVVSQAATTQRPGSVPGSKMTRDESSMPGLSGAQKKLVATGPKAVVWSRFWTFVWVLSITMR